MNELETIIEKDKSYIENYKLNIDEGTIKMKTEYHLEAVNERNAFVHKKTKYYNDLKEKIYNTLKEKIESQLPKNTKSNYENINKSIESLKELIIYNNSFNDIFDKLGFNKIISDLNDVDSSDLMEINFNIKKIITSLKNSGVNIKKEDFSYTPYTLDYMTLFVDKMDDNNFETDIKNKFESIYWQCPMIITHLKLNLRHILNKYSKVLNTYHLNKRNELFAKNNVKEDNYLKVYKEQIDKREKMLNSDTYFLSKNLLNGNLNITDYTENSSTRKAALNRFAKKDFEELTDIEKEDFFAQIKQLGNVVTELIDYNYFKPFIDDIKERYKAKDSYKGVVKNKLKEIKKEDKKRNRLNRKYTKKHWFKKLTDIQKEKIKLEINEQIKILDNLYVELDDALINESILKNVNETTTIYDALIFCGSFYNYSKLLTKKYLKEEDISFEKIYKRLLKSVYNFENVFTRKIPINEDIDIIEMIDNKYNLVNIKLNKLDLEENLESLQNSIKIVLKVHYMENSKLSFEDISKILEFNQIEK